MRTLRIVAIFFGALLIMGELWRSWGAGRPFPFVVDDVIVGAMLIVSGALMSRDTTRRRAFFTASWGVCAGMLYNSLFEKLIDPASMNPGNFEAGQLVFMVGVAFCIAVGGLVASIMAERIVT